MPHRTLRVALCLAALAGLTSVQVCAQAELQAPTGGECTDGTRARSDPSHPSANADPDSRRDQAEVDESIRQAFIQQQKQRVETERRLNKLRAQHFGSMRNEQIRQAGILKLQEETDPAVFPSLVKVYRKEREDVLRALCQHWRNQKTDEADATLTWIAVFDEREEFRTFAAQALKQRMERDTDPEGEVRVNVGQRVSSVIATAFKPGHSSESQQNAAAELAAELKLIQAIPALIQAQVQGTTAAISPPRGDTGTALGYIIVGQQQSFVADLQPIVADSAVGFDPQLSVVTDGTVLRVIDAAVITYRTEINRALVRLSSDAWGRSTAHLGWDQRGWAKWYLDEFLPSQQAKAESTPVLQDPDSPGPG
jgi:hypothetical protein